MHDPKNCALQKNVLGDLRIQDVTQIAQLGERPLVKDNPQRLWGVVGLSVITEALSHLNQAISKCPSGHVLELGQRHSDGQRIKVHANGAMA